MTEKENLPVVKSKLNKNDVKIKFSFSLEDINGEQINISDGLTFKSGLEPGLIDSLSKRVGSTLSAVGQDYFMVLFRNYINKKQEEVFKSNLYNSPVNLTSDSLDSKLVATGVVETIPEDVKIDADVEVTPKLDIE